MSAATAAAQRAPIAALSGATGYLGKHLCRAFSEAGYRVRALCRDESRLGWARPFCAEVVAGAVDDDAVLARFLDGARVVYSGVGIREPRRKPSVWDVDYAINARIFAAAQHGAAERLLFVCAIAADRLENADPAAARERVIAELVAGPRPYTVVRSTNYFSDMAGVWRLVQRGCGVVVGADTLLTNPVHGADLAAEMVRLASTEEGRNQIVSRGGPEPLSIRQIMTMALAHAGHPPRLLRLPLPLLSAARVVTSPFNPTVAGYLSAVTQYLRMPDLLAPACGTRRLDDFFAALARGEDPEQA